MTFWKPKTKDTEQQRLIIARIEGKYEKDANNGASIGLALGVIVMLAAAILKQVQFASPRGGGAIWTGWNVLCGISVINSAGSIGYIVYREHPPT